MTKQVPLTQGKFALVDDEDFEWLSQHKWHLSQHGYAARGKHEGYPKKTVGILFMHRVILNAPSGTEVDHINGNRLDNRRSNLRLCTRRQNLQNSRKRDNSSSLYKGVYFDKSRNKWQAYIDGPHGRIHLGRFSQETDAARAYDEKAKEVFGEFARLNFPS